MQALDLVRPRGDGVESRLHLSHVVELERNVELPQLRWPEPEFASGDAIGTKLTMSLQAFEVTSHALNERHVTYPGLEIAPDMVDVQFAVPLSTVPRIQRRRMFALTGATRLRRARVERGIAPRDCTA